MEEDVLVGMTAKRFAISVIVLFTLYSGAAFASEADAIAISQNIRARHMPFGTILDPIFATPDSDEIVGYTHCGDSAIWTGHYLAAEATATTSPDRRKRWTTSRRPWAGLNHCWTSPERT
jgi:hypothetical protein